MILFFNCGRRGHVILCGSLSNFNFILTVVVINYVIYVAILADFDFIFSIVVIHPTLFFFFFGCLFVCWVCLHFGSIWSLFKTLGAEMVFIGLYCSLMTPLMVDGGYGYNAGDDDVATIVDLVTSNLR